MSNFITILNPLVTGTQATSALLTLVNAGGRLLQAWGNSILIADGEQSAQNAVRSLGPFQGIALVTDGPIQNIDLLGLVPELKTVLEAWNLSLTPEYQAGLNQLLALNLPMDNYLAPGGCNYSSQFAGTLDRGFQALGGLFGPLPIPILPPPLRYPNRRALVGNIGVAVLMIDGKDGTEAAFSASEAMGALAAIKLGLQKLQEQAPAGARLIFHPFLWGAKLDIDPGSVPRPVDPKNPTRQEYQNAEAVWLNEAFKQLRLQAGIQVRDGLDGLQDIVKNSRFMFNVDWGYTIVITKYRAGWPAYVSDSRDVFISYLMWEEHRVNLQVDPLPVVVAHETGHTVEAYDEYASNCNSLDLCGWSHTVNGNCYNPFEGDPCIMNKGIFSPCTYTRRHFGWADHDNDGVVDPYDQDYVIPGIPVP